MGIASGTYVLMTRKKGYKPATKVVVLSPRTLNSVDLVLESEQALTVAVHATRLRAQNGLSPTGTSKYTMTQRDIAELAAGQATPLNQVVLQMPGVALDQNQEIHIRGEHAGVPVPDERHHAAARHQQRSDLYPAPQRILRQEREPHRWSLARAIRISHRGRHRDRTKNGCEGADSDFTILGGQRDTVKPSFELGGCHGNFSYYLTGVYLHSNLGLSSATPAPDPIHDGTDQGQGFAYLTYTINPTTKLSLIQG